MTELNFQRTMAKVQLVKYFRYRKIPKISPSMYKPLQLVTQKPLC